MQEELRDYEALWGQKWSLSNGYRSLKELTPIKSKDTRKIKQKSRVLVLLQLPICILSKMGETTELIVLNFQKKKFTGGTALLSILHNILNFTINFTQECSFLNQGPVWLSTLGSSYLLSLHIVWGAQGLVSQLADGVTQERPMLTVASTTWMNFPLHPPLQYRILQCSIT